MLTPFLKSSGFSLFAHATVLSLLCLIPASLTDRFSSSGQTIVLSMEFGAPSATAQTVSITSPPTLLPLLDSNLDSMPPVDTIDPRSRTFTDRRIDTIQNTVLPEFAAPIVPIKLSAISETPQLKRRERNPDQPRTDLAVTPVRKRHATANRNQPPTDLAKQLDQIVGLEDKTAADFSKNLPPSYPLIAVRQKLEGVVMLRLNVTASGSVARVEVAESSGHAVLDKAAMTAISKWQGKPATRWGRPTESTEVLPIRFKL